MSQEFRRPPGPRPGAYPAGRPGGPYGHYPGGRWTGQSPIYHRSPYSYPYPYGYPRGYYPGSHYMPRPGYPPPYPYPYPPPPYSSYPGIAPDMPVIGQGRRGNTVHNYYQQTTALIEPAVQHSLREVEGKGTAHAVKEAALLGYLMGRGYEFKAAVPIVESWEVGGLFPV